MSAFKIRFSQRGAEPAVVRTLLIPSECTFLDLHLILQRTLGWSDEFDHTFDVDGKTIGPKAEGVFEEADEHMSIYEGSRTVYVCGGWTFDIVFQKGSKEDVEKPCIIASEGYFPPNGIMDQDEYIEFLDGIEAPERIGDLGYLEKTREVQEAENVNKDLSEWDYIGPINGRIPFGAGAAIAALLISGCEGYYYDTLERRLTEETDGSDRYLPVSSEEGLVGELAAMYLEKEGVSSDDPLATVLGDDMREGWEEYAENFLDEITDDWADRYGFLINRQEDSDIDEIMQLFGKEDEDQ